MAGLDGTGGESSTRNGQRRASWVMNAKRVTIVVASLALAGALAVSGSAMATRALSAAPRLQLMSAARPESLSPRQLARLDASQLLGLARLPQGSKRVSGEPNGDGGLLSSPAQSAAGNLVDLHRFYEVAEDPAVVYAFFQSHTPDGSTSSGAGTSGNSVGTDLWTVSYNWPPIRGVLDTRALVNSIAALPENRSGIRVDAEVTWLPAKPTGDIVPPGATVLTAVLSAGLNPGEAGHAPVTTTDPQTIEAIRAFINGLGVFPPGLVSCPADFGQNLTISFAKSATAAPFDVVVAAASGCEQVQVQAFGHAVQPKLWGAGPPLVPFVEHELGFS